MEKETVCSSHSQPLSSVNDVIDIQTQTPTTAPPHDETSVTDSPPQLYKCLFTTKS